MMEPDYTHWHGTYEIARNFYTEMVPELEELIEKGKTDADAKKRSTAVALETKLHEVLNSPNHRWFLNKQDPAEATRRKKAAAEFKARYQK